LFVDTPDNQGGSLKESNISETLHDRTLRMNGLISIATASRPRTDGIAREGEDLIPDKDLGIVEMGMMGAQSRA
jgi:hypothetical protein